MADMTKPKTRKGKRKITVGWRITGADVRGIRLPVGIDQHNDTLRPCLEGNRPGVLFRTRAYAREIIVAMNERLTLDLAKSVDFRVRRVVRWV